MLIRLSGTSAKVVGRDGKEVLMTEEPYTWDGEDKPRPTWGIKEGNKTLRFKYLNSAVQHPRRIDLFAT